MSGRLSPLFTWRGALCESDLKPTHRHVALTLSLHMNERGGSCFPSIETQASETGLNEKTVKRALAALDAAGWLRREYDRSQKGRGTVVRYTATIPTTGTQSTGSQSTGSDDHRDSVSGPQGTSVPTTGTESTPPYESDTRTTSEGVSLVVADELGDAGRLCEALADSIEHRGAKRPTVTKAWLTEMDRLLRIDGRDPNDVAKVIRWLHDANDDVAAFWQPNIRSPQKLRTKWDQMREQYSRQNGGVKRNHAADYAARRAQEAASR